MKLGAIVLFDGKKPRRYKAEQKDMPERNVEDLVEIIRRQDSANVATNRRLQECNRPPGADEMGLPRRPEQRDHNKESAGVDLASV